MKKMTSTCSPDPMGSEGGKMKKQLLLLFAGILAVLLLVWFTDFQEVFAVLLDFQLSILVLICTVQLAKYILLAIQWKSIVKASGHHIGFGKMTHIIMSGKFIECITPGFKVGGEITKTVMLPKHTSMSIAEAIAVTATQKSLNFLALIVLCLLSVTALLSNIHLSINPSLKTTLLVGALLLLGLGMGLVALISNPQWAKTVLPQKNIETFRLTVTKMYRRPIWLVGQMTLTLIIWSTYAIISIIIAETMGIGIKPLYTVIATYLSYMLGMIPLLPGGLGTTEAGLTGTLAIFGVTVNTAMAMTLMLRLVTYWLILLVSTVWFLGHKITRIFSLQKQSSISDDLNISL